MSIAIANHRIKLTDEGKLSIAKSPNIGGQLDPRYLVIHYTAGQSADAAVSWLASKESKASAHVVIGRDGSITQLVPFNRVAFHAGVSSWDGIKGLSPYSIGFELDNAGRLKRIGNSWVSWFGRVYPEDEIGWYTMVNMRDFWEVNMVGRTSSERLNYPTQKPEALLERIILASSNPGDIVFDCFMGSGTTQAVAMKLGRKFIGADINLGALHVTTDRLLGVADQLLKDRVKQQDLEINDSKKDLVFYTGIEVYNVNHYDVFRNPVDAKDLLLEALEVHRLEQGHIFDGEKDGRMVKIMPINRISTRADLNELIAGMDYKSFEKSQADHPNQPVEKITLVCMGHEPDLAAILEQEVQPFKIDVEVVDILRDKQDLQFKRDSEANIIIDNGHLKIDKFYPMNLLQKLSLQKESVDDWRELVESIMIDWNYDGAILEPSIVDIPENNGLVAGRYPIPDNAGTIRIKITDLLSESLEQEVQYG